MNLLLVITLDPPTFKTPRSLDTEENPQDGKGWLTWLPKTGNSMGVILKVRHPNSRLSVVTCGHRSPVTCAHLFISIFNISLFIILNLSVPFSFISSLTYRSLKALKPLYNHFKDNVCIYSYKADFLSGEYFFKGDPVWSKFMCIS